MSQERDVYRLIPQVDDLARSSEISGLLDAAGRPLGLRLLRGILDDWRASIGRGEVDAAELERLLAGLPEALQERTGVALQTSLVGVVNATGVVVHTNLGRAVLCDAAQRAMARATAGYTNLEYDIPAGKRGSRMSHLEQPLQALFPGHAAMAVNNNASALLLALNTLARGKEVVVSRGELVEIGGSFRIPEIMERSGVVLREVGTTNRTRLEDYRAAIGDNTGVLLKVHPSNYRILGFTEEASLEDLAALGREHDLPVVMDQGSGNLIDLSPFGVGEPPVSTLLESGIDVVLFSGDKLLGGPQAGIAVGKLEWIQAMKRSPLARVLRLDKGTVAALEATLLEYVRGREIESIPVLRMIAAARADLAARAETLATKLRAEIGDVAEVTTGDGSSVVGGGAWPLGKLPTCLVSIRPAAGGAGGLEERLRAGTPAVIGRVEDGRLRLDLRTVLPEQEDTLARSVVAALR